jgi:hypothetical protein
MSLKNITPVNFTPQGILYRILRGVLANAESRQNVILFFTESLKDCEGRTRLFRTRSAKKEKLIGDAPALNYLSLLP